MTAEALNLAAAEADSSERPWRRALRRLVRRRAAVAGLAVVLIFAALAILAPLVSPYDPLATNWALVRKPPSALHWFGTDDLGRDILSRVVYGARASLMAGAISVGIALGIGVPFGLLSGYRGGFIDALISRITDAMLACPFLILAIALAAINERRVRAGMVFSATFFGRPPILQHRMGFAYSRPGGYSPLCYATHITDDAARTFCRSHNLN